MYIYKYILWHVVCVDIYFMCICNYILWCVVCVRYIPYTLKNIYIIYPGVYTSVPTTLKTCTDVPIAI